MAARVADLILATRHHGAPSSADAAVLVDIDLAILGAGANRFEEYERQVRQEFSSVPGLLFRRERRKILEGSLARSHVYFTDYFRGRFEVQARANLERSIERLAQGP